MFFVCFSLNNFCFNLCFLFPTLIILKHNDVLRPSNAVWNILLLFSFTLVRPWPWMRKVYGFWSVARNQVVNVSYFLQRSSRSLRSNPLYGEWPWSSFVGFRGKDNNLVHGEKASFVPFSSLGPVRRKLPQQLQPPPVASSSFSPSSCRTFHVSLTVDGIQLNPQLI